MLLTLEAARVNRGLKQTEVAEILGITPETLSKWERGITFPNVPQITKLEDLYGLSYAEIDFYPQKSV